MMDAVIFDCDGVLIDSEIIIQRVSLAYLTDLGLRYDPEDFAARFLGVTWADFFAGLDADHHDQFGRPLPADFGATLNGRARAEIDTHLNAMHGIHDVVADLRLPKAVASGSSPETLERCLRKVALFDHFAPHIYSAQIMPRGKPAPDVYLHAARQIDVAPTRCVAVEDSVNGTASAVAAGMRVIGFTGGGHCPPTQAARLRAAGAVDVAATMDELYALLLP